MPAPQRPVKTSCFLDRSEPDCWVAVSGSLRKELMASPRVHRGEKPEWCLKRMEAPATSAKELRRATTPSSEALRLTSHVFG